MASATVGVWVPCVPGREVEGQRGARHLDVDRRLMPLDRLEDRLGEAVDGRHDRVRMVRGVERAQRHAATPDGRQRPRGCPEQSDEADGRVADGDAERDDRALAVPDDGGAPQVEVGTGAHGPDRIARVIDPREERGRLPRAVGRAAPAGVDAERRDADAGQRRRQAARAGRRPRRGRAARTSSACRPRSQPPSRSRGSQLGTSSAHGVAAVAVGTDERPGQRAVAGAEPELLGVGHAAMVPRRDGLSR